MDLTAREINQAASSNLSFPAFVRLAGKKKANDVGDKPLTNQTNHSARRQEPAV